MCTLFWARPALAGAGRARPPCARRSITDRDASQNVRSRTPRRPHLSRALPAQLGRPNQGSQTPHFDTPSPQRIAQCAQPHPTAPTFHFSPDFRALPARPKRRGSPSWPGGGGGRPARSARPRRAGGCGPPPPHHSHGALTTLRAPSVVWLTSLFSYALKTDRA